MTSQAIKIGITANFGIAVFLSGVVTLLWPSLVTAQDFSPTVVAIVDYQRILEESSATRAIKEQLLQRRQLYQNEITKQEQGLRQADQDLSRQRAILAPDAFAQKRREFEAKVAEVQLGAQTRKKELDEAWDYSVREVQTALRAIIAELAKERGFNLVLGRSQVMYADSKYSISDEVLARLNERLPTVSVPDSTN